jgi:hypothetical protein
MWEFLTRTAEKDEMQESGSRVARVCLGVMGAMRILDALSVLSQTQGPLSSLHELQIPVHWYSKSSQEAKVVKNTATILGISLNYWNGLEEPSVELYVEY